MVFPFASKKREGEPSRAYIPVNLVQRYASQGIPEREIAARLRSQGFAPGQIDAAIRSVLRERVAGPQRGPPQGPQQEFARREPSPDEFPTMQMTPRETGGPAPMPPRREPQQVEMPKPEPVQSPEPEQEQQFTFEGSGSNPMESALGEVTLEEIIEGIVAEKWQDFEERLANFEERDLQLQQQIQDVRHSVKEVEKVVESKEQNLVGKFDEFSGSFSDIQGRIGSIEKVFKDILPELSKNVKALSDIAERKP